MEGGLLSKYLGILGNVLISGQEPLTDFWVEINQSLEDRSLAVIVSAAQRGGDTALTDARAAQSNGASESFSRAEQRSPPPEEDILYTLLDLEESPAGVSRRDVVSHLYPRLVAAMREFTRWSREQTIPGNEVSDADILKRFPVLKFANAADLRVLRGKTAPSNRALEIMQQHTGLEFYTVKKYAFHGKVTKRSPRAKVPLKD